MPCNEANTNAVWFYAKCIKQINIVLTLKLYFPNVTTIKFTAIKKRYICVAIKRVNSLNAKEIEFLSSKPWTHECTKIVLHAQARHQIKH